MNLPVSREVFLLMQKRFVAATLTVVLAGVLIMPALQVHADTAPVTYWTHQFGASSGSSLLDFALAVDSDGSAYVIGSVDGALPGASGSGGRDAFVRKYSHRGELLWTDQFGTAGEDSAFAVAVAGEYVYVTGQVAGTLPGQTSSGNSDLFIRAYDTAGAVQWTHQYGSEGHDLGAALSTIPTGTDAGVYITGTTGGTLPGEVALGDTDAYVVKYALDGTFAWATQYGTESSDSSTGITLNAGGIFTTGANDTGAFLSTFDALGTHNWIEYFGTNTAVTYDIEPKGITSASGSVYITGTIEGSFEDTVELGSGDGFLVKYDTDGSFLWHIQLGTSESDAAYGVAVANHDVDTNNVIIVGETSGTLAGESTNGGTDAFMQAYGPDGSLVWTKHVGTNGYDIGRGLSLGVDEAYVVGITDGVFPDEINTGGYDAFISHITWSDDYDADTIKNDIDYYPLYVSNEFNDEGSGGTTSGTVDSINDQILVVADDEQAENGVHITADPAGAGDPAIVSVCAPQATYALTPADEIVVTCGSVHTSVLSGDVDVTFLNENDEAISGTLPEDTVLSFDQAESTFTADENNPEAIELTVGSSTHSIEPGETETVQLDTETDDTEGPITQGVATVPNPAHVDVPLTIVATTSDTTTGSSPIEHVYASVDGLGTTSMGALDGLFDEDTENVTGTLPAYSEAGVHNVCVWAEDTVGNVGTQECFLLAVYDPEAGSVVGAGWINSPLGAYRPDQSLTGKALFAFYSRYRRGVSVPSGDTAFRLKVADMTFISTSYDWLVVAGPRAQFWGTGQINGSGNYGFTLSAIDEARPGGGTVDRFRMKIWDKNNGNTLVYDNNLGLADTGDPTTALQGGNIIILNH